MPMTYADKCAVLRKLCGFRDAKAFSAALKKVNPHKTINGTEVWKTRPHGWKHDLIAETLNRHRPDHLLSLDFGMILDDDNLAMLDFMSKVEVSWNYIESVVTDAARNDWEHSVPFLQSLETFSTTGSQKALNAFTGTFYLYRKHSVLPGILREIIHINVGRCRNSGLYLQYKVGVENSSPVDITVFHAGSYLFVVGSLPHPHQDLCEIINMYISLGPTPDDQAVFSGILTGIYDTEKTILSERILLRKESDEYISPSRLQPDVCSSDEYRVVSDMIDNSLDGQTFSLRQSRLEWLPKSGSWSLTGK